MEISGAGKSPNTGLSFRYNANNEEIEELYSACDDDPPTPQFEASLSTTSDNASPKKLDKTSSIIDKYFKSIRPEKAVEKPEDVKVLDTKPENKVEEKAPNYSKDVTSSPMKEYLNRLGKRREEKTSESSSEIKENTNEPWKLFHDFKFKIAQAVEDMKTRSVEETKEKSVPRENSTSDSEENSGLKDSDQQSVGDTDNQVSSLHSSIQNLSELTQPLTAKVTERELSVHLDYKNNSESSDDTHKNLGYNEPVDNTADLLDDNSMMEVESGVEVMEDTNMDGLGEMSNAPESEGQPLPPVETPPATTPPTPTNFGLPPSKSNIPTIKQPPKPKSYFLNFFMYLLTILLIVSYVISPNSNIWNGFIFGLWFFCFASNLKQWLLDNYFSEWESDKQSFFQIKRTTFVPQSYTIPSVKEHRPLKKYEGWINHYRFPDYDPYTYHINKTSTAFMKLEGCDLRLSYTRTKIAKRALWDEQIEKVVFYQHRLYNLTGARVILLPKGLVKKRQWSKKYPICIILNEKEKIQVLEKEGMPSEKKSEVGTEKKASKEQQVQFEAESTETNASPEKKKKFVWRRREKSISHSDGETGREGLRHRLVRKMHRDKKPDSVSASTEMVEGQDKLDESSSQDADLVDVTKSVTSTKDELADEELDENEISRIKEFLEEAELEAAAECAEGEWSVRVKDSKDGHAHVYLFARTGRDKHEWFRRITAAITEAGGGAEPVVQDERPAADTDSAAARDPVEIALFKVATDKDAVVGFTKNTNTAGNTEAATVTLPASPVPTLLESYEKTFWPYLFKIIQPKSASPDCECHQFPAEVTWLNTVIARVAFDVMRDPDIIARVQARIQRKLHTLKLPSFMSPLVVTQLSLAGACPLVRHVGAVSWDERGVWLDADLRYDGGACISILTQINLLKLKEKNITLEDQFETDSNMAESELTTSNSGGLFSPEKHLRMRKPAIFDPDVEDSAESSSDEDSPPPHHSDHDLQLSEPVAVTPEGGSSKKKFLRMVDKIATNKYFQQVTDYKYVKRAMEGLSNTDIKLQLEVHALDGRLAINLPPPPHDRVWIGFRTNPQLVLKARPAVGARTLRFAHISNWIEQKLSKEFEKVLVLPNMEDIVVDMLTPTPVDFE